MSSMHVVFGGTGRAGRAVVEALLAQNAHVRVINRSGHADLPADVEVVAADVFNQKDTIAAAQGAEVIYNCTNPVRYNTQAWSVDFPLLWDNVTAAAAHTGARLIVSDNIYMYGPVDGPINEATPYRPTTGKGKIRAQMAERLLEAHARGEVQAAIGRAGDFYGPHCEFANNTYFRPALAGQTAYAFLRADAPHTVQFIDDVGTGLVALGANPQALGKVWHLPAAQAPTQGEFLHLVFEELHATPQIAVLPLAVVEQMATQNEVLRENLENAYMFQQPVVLDSSAIEQTFGLTPTPLREGIRRTLAWLQTQPAE